MERSRIPFWFWFLAYRFEVTTGCRYSAEMIPVEPDLGNASVGISVDS